jgi:hypothetical protein
MRHDWGSVIRQCGNGRAEVHCATAGTAHSFWLTPQEQDSWTVCPHCVGWWDLSGLAVAGDAG